jgi:hypothetical protein
MKRLSLVVFAFASSAVAAGCATHTSYPAASYPAAAPVLVGPNTNAPRLENSDAAGVLSVPGYHSVPTPAEVVTPVPTVVTPAPAVVVPAPAVVVPPR